MSDFNFSTDVNQQEYDSFVAVHPYGNLLQSWNWAAIKSNWDKIRTVVRENGEIAAAATVLKKTLPGGFSMLYIPRGPVMDFERQDLLDFYMASLRKEAKKHKALFVKMDPSIQIGKYASHDQDRPRNGNEKYVESFEKAGCLHQGFTMQIEESIQPRFHSIIDKPEDILSSLPKKTRKMIKEAEKRNLKIISGRDELLDDFARLVSLTESRKHVSLRSREYFKLLLDTYGEDAVIMLAVADPGQILKDNQSRLADLEAQIEKLPENQKKKRFTLEEQKAGTLKDIENIQGMIQEVGSDAPLAIAGVLTIAYGKCAEMLYAGMDERFRRFMPQYKTYVENFKWAFDKGCIEFSMGGVEGSLDDGLTHFKDNFAPLIHEYIGEFDLPVNRLLYKPSKIAYEKMRSRLKEN